MQFCCWKVLGHCKLIMQWNLCCKKNYKPDFKNAKSFIFNFIEPCILLFTCNPILGCYGKLKPNKKTDSGTMVTERDTLIWSKFYIMINFLELICLLGNTVKRPFWFQTSKLINKLSLKFLFPGIEVMTGTVFTLRMEWRALLPVPRFS